MPSLEETIKAIADRNQSARERESSRVSALVDITVKGLADEFSSFVREWESDVGGPRRESLAEVESPKGVGGNAGDAVIAAGSG